ncbi:putative cardiolipin synthase [Austwickia sp. TVS 96-490-7B]|uniref:CDP-alcohol phosphatidyltransferase family protein n=1 Tax=Austwickia sp. TVS 96-490-7B TaxID=2830843 RepID=UPI001D9D1B6A|nr:CDP-alcohol phosphatidyltransferase family protein [Austwickia sp. TVS 96-490-7B]MBW3086285.1 putative cardiolipin synthase [Austwickia sp. TVS 96-490-7B]
MELESDGSRAGEDRIWTVANVLSMLRLVGVPVFLWLIVLGEDGAALLVLALSGVTDYLDGQVARRTHTVTRLGQVLDPVADRLYILSTLIGLLVRGVLPWWFAVALLSRDLLGAGVVRWVRRAGFRGLPVHFVGKAATFNLLYAFPLLLLAQWRPGWSWWVLPVAWAFAIWGLLLYWLALVMYVVQARRMVAEPDLTAE